MCDCPEIQEFRINREYPEFPHRIHKAGDYFVYRDPNTIVVRMTGDDSPNEPVIGIYVVGSEQVHGANIPKKEQYLSFIGGYKVFKDPLRELIWLPIEHQLQKMVQKNYETAYGLLIRFIEWADTLKDIRSMSMKQLWLGFVMEECHHKYWNVNKWIGHASKI